MEYYSAMRKKEILPIVTTWMKCEGVMLSEKHQMETYCMILLICEILKSQIQRNRIESGAGGMKERGRYWSKCISFQL